MWICIAYTLTEPSKEELKSWAINAGLPEIDTEKLHITAAYSKQGFNDSRVKELLGSVSFKAIPVRIDCFDPGDRTTRTPLVLVCKGDFVSHAESLRNKLDNMDIPVVRHEEGFNPHITICKLSATEARQFVGIPLPELEMEIDGIIELHALKKTK